jgi:TatD DNase family protein
MLVDTHAHVNFKDFKDDKSEVIKRALDNEIWMINIGSQFSTSERAVKIAENYKVGVYAAVGLHPVHLSAKNFQDEIMGQEKIKFEPRSEEFKKQTYLKLAQNKKVIAIGEVGLDYFHNKDNKEVQKKIFEDQIDLACELNLPTIIHCREAHKDAIEILRNKAKEHGERLKGVMHCFSGGTEEARIYIEELGLYLGFNGIITFSRNYDEILKKISLENVLVETDCPYLTPVPFRGKRNEPLYVQYVAKKIAEIKEINLEKIIKKTTENAKKLFNLNQNLR